MCLLNAGPANLHAQAVPSIAELLTAAEKYLETFDRDSHPLFAEERSAQTQNQVGRVQENLQLRSNVLMFRDGQNPVWIRDVIERNGAPIISQPDRLMAVVKASTAPPGAPIPILYSPMQIVAESAQQQYGGGFRAVNQPGCALGYLRAGRPANLPFKSEGVKTIDGTKTVLLTLKDAPGDSVVPFAVSGVQGRFWIEPVSGRVVQTELEFIMLAVYRTMIAVRYAVDKALNIVVPVMMNDEYENRGVLVTGRADYKNFQKVTIDPSVFSLKR